MFERTRRLHGYDTVFDRMDRKELISQYLRIFPDMSQSSLGFKTRSELIEDLLVAEDRKSQSGAQQGYPIRRKGVSPSSMDLAEYTGKSVFWSWEKDVRESAYSLATAPDFYELHLSKNLQQDTLILTAVDATPPLILSLEVVASVTDGVAVAEPVMTFSNPISVLEIEHRLRAKLPRRSQNLKVSIVDQVLNLISEVVVSPAPIFLAAGDCVAGISSAEENAIFAIAMLQANFGPEPECQSCGRREVSNLEAHFARPKHESLVLEIQDHVDDTKLVCSDCHSLMHQADFDQVSDFSRPACPECGERNPRSIIWGDPAILSTDDVVFAGCVIPSGRIPQWKCRSCETEYLVQKTHDVVSENEMEALDWLTTSQLLELLARRSQEIINP